MNRKELTEKLWSIFGFGEDSGSNYRVAALDDALDVINEIINEIYGDEETNG